jgi:hypothetical protein
MGDSKEVTFGFREFWTEGDRLLLNGTPIHLLDEYGSDAVRYWSANARLGTDTAFDTNILKVGKRLVTKLFNAGKFVLAQARGDLYGAYCRNRLMELLEDTRPGAGKPGQGTAALIENEARQLLCPSSSSGTSSSIGV